MIEWLNRGREMGYLHRVQPNKATTAQIRGSYDSKGQMVAPKTGKVLKAGKIDRGVSMAARSA